MNQAKIIGIVAIAKNFAIGKNGKIPWHYSSDLKFFKETTTGNAVVMGYNTWLSIGSSPLKNRLNIVLSRSKAIETKEDLLLMRNKQDVLTLAKYLKCDLFIIGGAKTYSEFLENIQEWIVTEIPLDIKDADSFMPENFLSGFRLSKEISLKELSVKFYSRS
jgi:dihydrofolate reductase